MLTQVKAPNGILARPTSANSAQQRHGARNRHSLCISRAWGRDQLRLSLSEELREAELVPAACSNGHLASKARQRNQEAGVAQAANQPTTETEAPAWRPNWFNSPSSWRPSKLLVACGRVTLSGAGSEGAAGASSAGFGFAGSATGFCGSEGAEGLTLPNSRVLFDLDLRQLCFAFMIFPPKIVSISLKPCADGVGEEDERLTG